MKLWHRASVAVALAGAMAVSVVAQPPGGGFGGMMQGGRGGMDPAAMLMNKSVPVSYTHLTLPTICSV